MGAAVVAKNATTTWFEPKLLFNPDDFAVEQRFFASKDGTIDSIGAEEVISMSRIIIAGGAAETPRFD